MLLGLALLTARAASAEGDSTGQLWANMTLDWRVSPRVTYALDIEPKVLISAPPGQPGWASLDLTPSADFVATKWADVVGEGVLGRTVQTDDLKTTEVTVRGGMRFHLFSRQERLLFNEQLPKRRMVVRDLVRWEWRRFSSRTTSHRAQPSVSATASSPLPPQPAEPERGRHDLPHRRLGMVRPHQRSARAFREQASISRRRQLPAQPGVGAGGSLYPDQLRNTIDEPFSTSENILDLQVKRAW